MGLAGFQIKKALQFSSCKCIVYLYGLQIVIMIISFKHKGLEKFFKTGSTAGIQAKHKSKLSLQLAALDAAETVAAMNVPGWQLHPLKGDLEDHWAVSVNGNWRLTFRFTEDGDAEIVDYQDYH